MKNLLSIKQILLTLFIFALTNVSIAQSKASFNIIETLTSINSLDGMENKIKEVYGLPDETKTSDNGEHYTKNYYINKKTKSERIFLTFDQRDNIIQIIYLFPEEKEAFVRNLLNRKFPVIDSGDGWYNQQAELGFEINKQGVASLLVIYSIN